MSQSQLNQKLSDREKCVHSIASLMGYFRAENIENEQLFSYLLETTRIALFASISEKQMGQIVDQCAIPRQINAQTKSKYARVSKNQ